MCWTGRKRTAFAKSFLDKNLMDCQMPAHPSATTSKSSAASKARLVPWCPSIPGAPQWGRSVPSPDLRPDPTQHPGARRSLPGHRLLRLRNGARPSGPAGLLPPVADGRGSGVTRLGGVDRPLMRGEKAPHPGLAQGGGRTVPSCGPQHSARPGTAPPVTPAWVGAVDCTGARLVGGVVSICVGLDRLHTTGAGPVPASGGREAGRSSASADLSREGTRWNCRVAALPSGRA